MGIEKSLIATIYLADWLDDTNWKKHMPFMLFQAGLKLNLISASLTFSFSFEYINDTALPIVFIPALLFQFD